MGAEGAVEITEMGEGRQDAAQSTRDPGDLTSPKHQPQREATAFLQYAHKKLYFDLHIWSAKGPCHRHTGQHLIFLEH